MKSWQKPSITYLGKVDWRDQKTPFGLKQKDREYHTYLLGKTGVGKSNLLLSKIFQDIKNQRGVCVFDVHGDLIQTINNNIPLSRSGDVVYLNVPDDNLAIGFNPLRKVSYAKRSLVASSLLNSFQKLWFGAWGAKLEHILRYIFLSLLDQPKANLRDIVRILQDETYQNECIKNIVNPDVKNFWEQEFPKYSKNDITPILNKVGSFLVHPKIKRVLIENKQQISFRKIMDEKKILLINLSKGALGSDVAHILGSLLLSTITSASFNRIEIPEKRRIPFHLYLDEFHNYTNKSIVEMLSELRKFKITLTLAHQYLQQLDDDIRHGVLGNVGSILCFRIGAVDAEYMLMELFKEYQSLSIGDFVNLKNHHLYIKMMVDGKPTKPFSAKTLFYKEFL